MIYLTNWWQDVDKILNVLSPDREIIMMSRYYLAESTYLAESFMLALT